MGATRNVMRLVLAVLVTGACGHLKPEKTAPENPAIKTLEERSDIQSSAERLLKEGRQVFRHDTLRRRGLLGRAAPPA